MKSVLVIFSLLIPLDALWLGLVAKSFYQSQIGGLLKKDVNWLAAVLFYCLFSVALSVFVVKPALNQGSLLSAIILGGFFGLVAYATYDLTNQAVLKDWPLLVTVVDIAWGTFVAALVSALSYLILQRI